MSRGALEVEITRAGETVTAVARGELDLTNTRDLERSLPGVRPGERLVLDLRGLDFMDSTGVRLVMRLDVSARREGWDLLVVAGPGAVARVLEVCRVGDRVMVVSDPAGVS